jgi:hypothetical protein
MERIVKKAAGAPVHIRDGVFSAAERGCEADDAETGADWLRRTRLGVMTPLIAPVPVTVEVTVGRTWVGRPGAGRRLRPLLTLRRKDIDCVAHYLLRVQRGPRRFKTQAA